MHPVYAAEVFGALLLGAAIVQVALAEGKRSSFKDELGRFRTRGPRIGKLWR